MIYNDIMILLNNLEQAEAHQYLYIYIVIYICLLKYTLCIFMPFLESAYVTDCVISVLFHHLTPGMDSRPEGSPVEAGVFAHFSVACRVYKMSVASFLDGFSLGSPAHGNS